MSDSEEITLVVSFLRLESETSTKALAERLSPVAEFFNRNAQSLGILDPKLVNILIYRSGGRGAAPKDRGDGLLYEAPFAEARYSVRIRPRLNDRGEKISPYSYVYIRWCESPPKLDAWLSRGADQHLIDFNLTQLKDEFSLMDVSFGVIINLTDFFPDTVIQCVKSKIEGRACLTAEVTYDSLLNLRHDGICAEMRAEIATSPR